VQLLQSLQNPFLGMLAGAVFTRWCSTSSATIGLAVVMATQGLTFPSSRHRNLFGAKIGTGITAILAAIGKPQVTKRAAAVHVLFNVLGAVIWLPFIAALGGNSPRRFRGGAHLQGVERLAEEVPRQIANAATIWATANAVIFLPFAALFAKMAIKIIRTGRLRRGPLSDPSISTTNLIQVPAMALERARMELGTW